MIIKEANILNEKYCTTKIKEIIKDEINYELIDTNIDNDIIYTFQNSVQYSMKH